MPAEKGMSCDKAGYDIVSPEFSDLKRKEERTMDKVFRCRDLGLDCDAAIRGGSEEEVLKKAAEHAKAVHNMTEIPAEVVVKVRAAIHEE